MSYYLHLLQLVSDSVDPWANEFNEWTWFYTLGEAPPDPACAYMPALQNPTTAECMCYIILPTDEL